MVAKTLLWLCMVALVSAGKRRMYDQKSRQALKKTLSDSSDPARYNFEWRVKYRQRGDEFVHVESRDGGTTKGSYSVRLPDGRTQTVTYYVDEKSGYVAKVTYEGKALHPEHRRRGEDEDSGSESREKEDEDDDGDIDLSILPPYGYKL